MVGLPNKYSSEGRTALRPHAHLARFAATTCLVALPFADLPAQAPQRSTITGLVKRSVDSLPVSMALVMLDSSKATATTDSSGAFVLREIDLGAHVIHVRRVGYEPATVPASVSDRESTHVVVLLQPTAQTLTTVTVSGRTIEVPSRFAAVAARASRNHGALFTAKDFAEEFTDRTADVLQRLPGVNVNDRSVTFARCQDMSALPSIFGGSGSGTAKVQVYVDGIRQGGNVGDILKSVRPNSIELMEVYTGVARIPPEFATDACAAIAIWTKAY